MSGLERDRLNLSLVVGSANPKTRHVYVDGNDACIAVADVVLASDWLQDRVDTAVKAALEAVADVIEIERFDFHFKRPVAEMHAKGISNPEFDKGYARAINYAACIVRAAADTT